MLLEIAKTVPILGRTVPILILIDQKICEEILYYY